MKRLNLQYSLDPAEPELVNPQEFQLAPPPEPAAGPCVDELYMSTNKAKLFRYLQASLPLLIATHRMIRIAVMVE